MLNIEEIKARVAKSKADGTWCFGDMDELIAEVERLKAKLETLTGIEASEHQQIATLKKALEMMYEFMLTAANISERPKCFTVDYFIQQAWQLTHETHGDAVESEGEK